MMNNDLTVFDAILYGNLGPWHFANSPDEKFLDMIDDVKVFEPNFTYLYEIHFIRPFNQKTRYYHKLITNETIQYCNQVIILIQKAVDNREKKYWLNDTLDKKLKNRIRDIGRLIKSKDYQISFIDSKSVTFDIDSDHKTETYIIHLLKIALIKIYLEIQEVFKTFRANNLLIEEDFYTQFLMEPYPDNTFLKISTPIIDISEPKKITEQTSSPADLVFNSFKYIHLETEPDNIGEVYDSLKSKKFIHKDTTLVVFKKIFSGQPIDQQVIWTGNISDLHYFIKLIHSINESVENLKQHHWEVACKCFVDKNGKPFDRVKLKDQKKPKLTALLIEKAAKHLIK
jgi:hypothetical protein